MRLILNGCEYAGTTTLAGSISKWATELMGGILGFHDHWKIPHISHHPHTDEENEQFLALSPRLKESVPAVPPRVPPLGFFLRRISPQLGRAPHR